MDLIYYSTRAIDRTIASTGPHPGDNADQWRAPPNDFGICRHHCACAGQGNSRGGIAELSLAIKAVEDCYIISKLGKDRKSDSRRG